MSMINKPTLYLETTIPSYLTSKSSRDLIITSHQQITREWWDNTRTNFEIYTSQAVIDEVSAGDPIFAARRLEIIANLPLLKATNEVEDLAGQYLEKLGLPNKASLDILHLAYSVAYEMDYLLTWNCAHLANGIIIRRLQNINNSLQCKTPIIVTPEELLEIPKGG